MCQQWLAATVAADQATLARVRAEARLVADEYAVDDYDQGRVAAAEDILRVLDEEAR